MFCSKCGTSIPDVAVFCPVCGTKTAVIPVIAPECAPAPAIQANVQTSAGVITDETPEASYTFHSKRFATFSNFVYSGRTFTTVDLFSNSMKLEMRPKKLNKIPEIRYDEIASTTVSKHFAVTSIFMLALIAAILVACVIANVGESALLMLLLIPLEIFSGINSKLTINLRNGNCVKLIAAHKDDVQTLKDELDKRTHSR